MELAGGKPEESVFCFDHQHLPDWDGVTHSSPATFAFLKARLLLLNMFIQYLTQQISWGNTALVLLECLWVNIPWRFRPVHHWVLINRSDAEQIESYQRNKVLFLLSKNVRIIRFRVALRISGLIRLWGRQRFRSLIMATGRCWDCHPHNLVTPDNG